jgi:hypothetical protein
MGQVVDLGAGGEGTGAGEDGAPQEIEVEIALARARPTWYLFWVVNGTRGPAITLGEGAVRQGLTVPLGEPAFVRAEIWDRGRTADGAEAEPGTAGPGRCIALTNPIWYVPRRALDSVPAERRGQGQDWRRGGMGA